jgi:hypothetical protein
LRVLTAPLALKLLYYLACVRRCGTPTFDFDDKEVTMNRFNVLRLDSTQTFLNEQNRANLNNVRGDGTG